MKDVKQEKAKQLGMNPGTAQHKLRKSLMFMMVQKLDMDYCFQCAAKIDTVEELSIEHKIPWMHSEDPVGLFFDLDNIAFSHLSCNSKASRGTKTDISNGYKVCSSCKDNKPLEEFSKRSEGNTYRSRCKECRSRDNKRK